MDESLGWGLACFERRSGSDCLETMLAWSSAAAPFEAESFRPFGLASSSEKPIHLAPPRVFSNGDSTETRRGIERFAPERSRAA